MFIMIILFSDTAIFDHTNTFHAGTAMLPYAIYGLFGHRFLFLKVYQPETLSGYSFGERAKVRRGLVRDESCRFVSVTYESSRLFQFSNPFRSSDEHAVFDVVFFEIHYSHLNESSWLAKLNRMLAKQF